MMFVFKSATPFHQRKCCQEVQGYAINLIFFFEKCGCVNTHVSQQVGQSTISTIMYTMDVLDEVL